MQSRRLQWVVRQASALSPIQFLHLRFVVEAAALEKNHTTSGADPLQRHADPSGACSDDAQIPFDQGSVL
jgi:hypothetical protein